MAPSICQFCGRPASSCRCSAPSSSRGPGVPPASQSLPHQPNAATELAGSMNDTSGVSREKAQAAIAFVETPRAGCTIPRKLITLSEVSQIFADLSVSVNSRNSANHLGASLHSNSAVEMADAGSQYSDGALPVHTPIAPADRSRPASSCSQGTSNGDSDVVEVPYDADIEPPPAIEAVCHHCHNRPPPPGIRHLYFQKAWLHNGIEGRIACAFCKQDYACETCNRHTEKPSRHMCATDVCHMLLSSSTERIRHERYTHSLETMLCPFCDERLKEPTTLRRHCEHFHPDRPRELWIGRDANAEENRFVVPAGTPLNCLFCPETFDQRKGLHDHLIQVHGHGVDEEERNHSRATWSAGRSQWAEIIRLSDSFDNFFALFLIELTDRAGLRTLDNINLSNAGRSFVRLMQSIIDAIRIAMRNVWPIDGEDEPALQDTITTALQPFLDDLRQAWASNKLLQAHANARRNAGPRPPNARPRAQRQQNHVGRAVNKPRRRPVAGHHDPQPPPENPAAAAAQDAAIIDLTQDDESGENDPAANDFENDDGRIQPNQDQPVDQHHAVASRANSVSSAYEGRDVTEQPIPDSQLAVPAEPSNNDAASPPQVPDFQPHRRQRWLTGNSYFTTLILAADNYSEFLQLLKQHLLDVARESPRDEEVPGAGDFVRRLHESLANAINDGINDNLESFESEDDRRRCVVTNAIALFEDDIFDLWELNHPHYPPGDNRDDPDDRQFASPHQVQPNAVHVTGLSPATLNAVAESNRERILQSLMTPPSNASTTFATPDHNISFGEAALYAPSPMHNNLGGVDNNAGNQRLLDSFSENAYIDEADGESSVEIYFGPVAQQATAADALAIEPGHSICQSGQNVSRPCCGSPLDDPFSDFPNSDRPQTPLDGSAALCQASLPIALADVAAFDAAGTFNPAQLNANNQSDFPNPLRASTPVGANPADANLDLEDSTVAETRNPAAENVVPAVLHDFYLGTSYWRGLLEDSNSYYSFRGKLRGLLNAVAGFYGGNVPPCYGSIDAGPRLRTLHQQLADAISRHCKRRYPNIPDAVNGALRSVEAQLAEAWLAIITNNRPEELLLGDLVRPPIADGPQQYRIAEASSSSARVSFLHGDSQNNLNDPLNERLRSSEPQPSPLGDASQAAPAPSSCDDISAWTVVQPCASADNLHAAYSAFAEVISARVNEDQPVPARSDEQTPAGQRAEVSIGTPGRVLYPQHDDSDSSAEEELEDTLETATGVKPLPSKENGEAFTAESEDSRPESTIDETTPAASQDVDTPSTSVSRHISQSSNGISKRKHVSMPSSRRVLFPDIDNEHSEDPAPKQQRHL